MGMQQVKLNVISPAINQSISLLRTRQHNRIQQTQNEYKMKTTWENKTTLKNVGKIMKARSSGRNS